VPAGTVTPMAATPEPERNEPTSPSSDARVESNGSHPPEANSAAKSAAKTAEASPRPKGEPQAAELEVRPPTRLELAWYRIVWSIVWPPGWFLWRPTVVGRENLPQTTPYIISPVHRSNIDTFLTARITDRRIRFMAKEGVFSINWIARVFSSLGSFPVRRGTPDRVALQICERALAAGEPVVLFPEGTRCSGPTIQELQRGPAFVALRANVPIVPVGIGGSERSMPVGASWVRPSKIALVIGRPIWPPPASGSGRVPRRAIDELTERLHAELQVLFDEAQRLAGAD
jgi:1-acyl-sn-glycerol-3-phosphate acyltransferase